MTHTLEPRLRRPFNLPDAVLPNGEPLQNVTVQLTRRLADASSLGAELFEAVLAHTDANGEFTQGLPEVVCKLVPIEPTTDYVPKKLGLREVQAYERIRANSGGIRMPLAHLVGYYQGEREHFFVIERYGSNALDHIQAMSDHERAAEVQHFFAAGYLALRHLNDRVKISMRDAHPRNFLSRTPMPGEPGFKFVAVDFGHANVGLNYTGEFPLEAMPIIQHPEVLAPHGHHRGLEDDLFSLAVSTHILLSKSQATPWVTASGARIHFDNKLECDEIRHRMTDAKARLKPDWNVFAGGANAEFLKMLAELLDPGRSREERRRYVTEELPALVERLEPWTAKSIAELEQSAAVIVGGTDPGVATVPNPPISATIPLASRQQSPSNVRAPHGIRYLAELEDFRPPPPPPAPHRSVLVKEQRKATGRRIHTALVRALPFVVLTALLALIKFTPGIGLDALREAQIVPRGWEMPSNVLLLVGFALGSAGLLLFRPSRAKTLPAALSNGIIAGLISGLALVAAPTAAVVGAESLLYVLPGTTWRFEDWAFWPQWVLVLGFLAAAGLGAGAFFVGGRSLPAAGAACLVVGLASAMISSAAPWSFPGQHVLQVDCGTSRYEFTHATQSLCIPDSQEWEQMEKYIEDPFVARMNLPKPSALGSGPHRTAVGLSSTQFPCLSLFVLSDRPDFTNMKEINVPQLTTDANSSMSAASPKGSEGRINRLRLGGGSYIVYRENAVANAPVSGTTVYSALSSRGPFANPEDFVLSGRQGTTVFQVQRDCPAADQPKIDQAAHRLISSIKLNERFRLDVSEIQFNRAALAAKNLDATRIGIPLPAGTSAAFYGDQQHPLMAVQGVIAVGGVILTNNQDFDRTSYATVSISDAAPEDYASATPSSEAPAWSMAALVSSEQEDSQNYYQKQTVAGTDYYVTVTLVVRDQGTYDDSAKQRFKKVLAEVHVENDSVNVLEG